MATLLGGSSPDRFEDPGPGAGPLDSCDTAPGGGGGVSAPSAAQQQRGPVARASGLAHLQLLSVGSVQRCAGDQQAGLGEQLLC